MPAGDEAVSVNAREEASKVLIVDVRCRFGVKVALFQQLNEFINISFGQVMWERCREKLVDELGNPVQHGPERGSEEADDRTTREELLLPFWGVRKHLEVYSPLPIDQGYDVLETSLQLGEHRLDQ